VPQCDFGLDAQKADGHSHTPTLHAGSSTAPWSVNTLPAGVKSLSLESFLLTGQNQAVTMNNTCMQKQNNQSSQQLKVQMITSVLLQSHKSNTGTTLNADLMQNDILFMC